MNSVLRCTLLAIALLGIACGEVQESHFDTAREARLATGGWLPVFLPDSVTDIWEVHDLDTNETWGAFQFSRRDEAAMRASFVPADASELRPSPSKSDRWPHPLRGRVSSASLTSAGLELCRSTVDDVFIAIDWKAGRAFFWRQGH